MKVLNKGLTFSPSHSIPNILQINQDIKRFERKLQLHYFFSNKKLTLQDHDQLIKPLFESNPHWWPRKLNYHITELSTDLKHTIFKTLKSKHKFNLPPSEINALRQLKSNTQIVIKKCDKGGGIAVLDKRDYLSKIMSMLNDPKTYTQIEHDDSILIKNNADSLLKDLAQQGFLNKRNILYFTNFEPRCPIFYGIPKIHKINNPLRPIVSQINGPTSRINELVDKLLTVAEKNIPHLLQDTTAFLQLIDKHKQCPPNTYLVVMDIVSLYTNIPQDEGINWVGDYYEETLPLWNSYTISIKPVDTKSIKQMMSFILQNCTFSFNSLFFKQNFGTTMGAKFSVKFANIYMHMWFRKFLPLYPNTIPKFLGRLVDDCFFTWPDSESSLLTFLNYLNNCHPSIKFEFSYSYNKVTFLDTTTYLQDNTIKTTIYTKPTDKKQYLHFNSCHPFHTKKAIPYSQALRYRRIIEDDSLLLPELQDLKRKFLLRGYPNTLLDTQLQRVHTINRNDTLTYNTTDKRKASFAKFTKGHSFLPLILPFHDSFTKNNLRAKFLSHWSTFLQTHPNINHVFQNETPQIVYKKNKTLAQFLVKTDMHTPKDPQDIENVNILASLLNQNDDVLMTTKCNHPKCKCCSHIICCSSFFNPHTKTQFAIQHHFTCNSKAIVYIIQCTLCHTLYIGQTNRQLKDRLNNHRSDVKLKRKTAIAIHFNEPLHSFKHLTICPLQSTAHLNIQSTLLLEKQFITTFNTRYPNGLNHFPLPPNT